MKTPVFTPEKITELCDNEVFVFGSNLAGRHAGGAARFAHERFGAVWGQGEGLQGQSYAIPTMQGGVETIAPYVDRFIEFAKVHQELHFWVTPIGCGIAGFSADEIAPLFRGAMDATNISLPESFYRILTSAPIERLGKFRTLLDICLRVGVLDAKAMSKSEIFDKVMAAALPYMERGTFDRVDVELVAHLYADEKSIAGVLLKLEACPRLLGSEIKRIVKHLDVEGDRIVEHFIIASISKGKAKLPQAELPHQLGWPPILNGIKSSISYEEAVELLSDKRNGYICRRGYGGGHGEGHWACLISSNYPHLPVFYPGELAVVKYANEHVKMQHRHFVLLGRHSCY